MRRNKIDRLYEKSLRIIERDIQHIQNLTLGAKLDPDSAMDLSRYVKLLADMKKAQEARDKKKAEEAKAATTALTDEQIEEALKTK